MSFDNVYREFILDHYRDPNNKGRLEEYDLKEEGLNPHCGDKIEMFLKLENGKISKIKHDGTGCAISQAGASLITQEVKNKSRDDILNITIEEMKELLKIPIDYTREKCATLALDTIQQALENK